MYFPTLLVSAAALTRVAGAHLHPPASQPRQRGEANSNGDLEQRDSDVTVVTGCLGAAETDEAGYYQDSGAVLQQYTVTVNVTVHEVTITTDCPVPDQTLLATTAVGTPDKGKYLSPVVITGTLGTSRATDTSLRTVASTPSIIPYNTSYTVDVKTISKSTATTFSLPEPSVEPQTTGILNTDLGETGQPTGNPLLTESIKTRTSLPTFSSPEIVTFPRSSSPSGAPSSVRTVPAISEAPFPLPNSTFYSNSSDAPPIISEPIGNGTSRIQPIGNGTVGEPTGKQNSTDSVAVDSKMPEGDIFADPIDTKALPRQFLARPDHPVPRTGIQSKGPLQTNKFYSNFFLGNQKDPVYTFPYSVTWVGGTGVSGSHGLAITHVEEKQRGFGPPRFNVPASYYINPIGIQSMIVSARELGNDTTLTIDEMTPFSARINLSANSTNAPAVSFPLLQGMPYVTAQYNGARPLLQTTVFFRTMTRATKNPKKNVTRYNFALEDGTVWRVYGYKTKGDELDLTVINNGVAMSSKPFYGTLQVVKEMDSLKEQNSLGKRSGNSSNDGDILDQGAGIYPVTMKLSGSVARSTGQYAFDFTKAGHQEGELLMFALPHHAQSFDKKTSSQQAAKIWLETPTKGRAILVKGSKWQMVEPSMATGLGFEPWHADKGSVKKISDQAKKTIQAAASKEVLQDMIATTDLNSMYWSGKALAKYAFMLYVMNDLLGDTKLAQTGLGQLKVAFARFADNKQQYPLVHETAWGGVVSSGAYVTGQALEDYGNTYYNDHHFHYGYHILAAAVIGHLDKSWVAKNKDYVNMLARDTSNPSAKDSMFPMWRSFDWYHGHSWATGLFASLDGKNQESTSEDTMHVYGLKMWGKISGNGALEARADLQLAVMARSMRNYFLYEDDNAVQPEKFIPNKVAGILFENKADHTTFFSNKIEAIQGIHMIPILPVTTIARKSKFVTQEWEAFFSKGRMEEIDNSWRSILLGNYATIAPKEAFEALSSKTFEESWLDGGISLTWLLAYSAALGGL